MQQADQAKQLAVAQVRQQATEAYMKKEQELATLRSQIDEKLKAANDQPFNDGFTDDASVVESYGHPITLVEGNRENIKITTPYDLKIAEVLVQ